MSCSKNGITTINIIKLLGLAMLLAACSNGGTEQPAPGSLTATGIAVSPEFQAFYDQNGGAHIFGFPISPAYVDSRSGRLTQYFQQLVLEYDRLAGVVMVHSLGRFFAPPEEDWVLVAGSGSGRQRTFPGTEFVVQDAFLAFYEANGDQLVFGAPITPQLDEGEMLVQYFENAQLVWNPNAPLASRVEVASLADAYYWQFGRLEPGSLGPADSAEIIEADVRAVVKEPILYAGEEQVLYVTVITPGSLQLVEGATVNVTVNYDGLSTTMIFANPTDQFGQTQNILEMPGVEPGDLVMVEIQAISAGGALLGKTMLSFRTWW